MGSNPVRRTNEEPVFTRALVVPQPAPDRALASLSGGFGRTLSPVSAVVIYCSGLVQCDPREVLRWVWLPLACGAGLAYLIVLL